jgi:preprotein translocase subunit YajC
MMTMFNWMSVVAMAAPPQQGQQANPTGQMLQMLLLFGGMGAMMYFLMIRPQQKQRKEMENMLKNLKSGDEVLTTGGVIGIVANVKEKEIVLKVADNVKLRVVRSAISSVIRKSDQVEVVEAK